MEIRPLRANGKTKGQTEMTKLVVSFRNFGKASETIFHVEIVMTHVLT
jgi:hypothetical protein